MRPAVPSIRSAMARSAMEQTDWHERGEKAFLEELVKKLDREPSAGHVQIR